MHIYKIIHKDLDVLVFGRRIAVGKSSEPITLTALYRTVSRQAHKKKSRIILRLNRSPDLTLTFKKPARRMLLDMSELRDWRPRAHSRGKQLVRAH